MLIGLVPVFNEENNIINVLEALEKQIDYTIIVNDGSLDKTDYLISKWLKAGKEHVYYFSYKKNRGQARALLLGFNFISEQYKKGIFSADDIAITIDGDGQHDPKDIKNMYIYFNDNNLDVLIAKRELSHYPKYRIFGNKLTSLVVSCLSTSKFEDIMCGFKMMRVAFIIDLLNYYIGYRFSYAGEIGITAGLLGYNIDNEYLIQCPYLRKGSPRFKDFLVNIILYLLLTAKIKFIRGHRRQIN